MAQLNQLALKDIRTDIMEQLGALVARGVVVATPTVALLPADDLKQFSTNEQLLGHYVFVDESALDDDFRVAVTVDLVSSPPTIAPHKDWPGAPTVGSTFEVYRYFSSEEVKRAIHRVLRDVSRRFLVPTINTGGITLVADTYEYNVPNAAGDLAAVYEVRQEGSTTGTYDVHVPHEHWRLEPSNQQISFDDRYFNIDATKRLKLYGYQRLDLAPLDQTVVPLDNEYIVNKVVQLLLFRLPWGDLDPVARRALFTAAKDATEDYERRFHTTQRPGTEWLFTS